MSTPGSIKKYQHPVFAGLSDKALVAFYSLGNVENHEAGSRLLRVGDKASDSFLLLSGQARIQGPGDDSGHVLLQGSTLPLAMYQRDGLSSIDFCATGPLSVLRFSELRLSGLDPDIQLPILRNLGNQHAQGAAGLLQQQLAHMANQQLSGRQVLDELEADFTHYSSSRPLVELLRKLPRLPSYATRLTQMLSDPNVSTREAFETAKLDPSLTASVLKTVNSSAYSLKHKVVDFQHAFVLLGFNQIQQIILNSGVQSIMPKAPEFQQLQLHSVMVSALCQEIALTLKQGNPPLLGTIGLLHDIGKSVLLLLKREQAQLGFLIDLLDADLIGTMLLREWELPQDICSSLKYQSLPCQVPPGLIPDAQRVNMAILHVAHLCFDFLMEKPLDGRQLRFCREYFRALGSNAGSVQEFMRDELLPAVQLRMNNMPKVIQNFLNKGMMLTATPSEASPEGGSAAGARDGAELMTGKSRMV